jgi:hypothetical protein
VIRRARFFALFLASLRLLATARRVIEVRLPALS